MRIKGKPLLFLTNGTLVTYKRSVLYFLNIENGNRVSHRLFLGYKERWLSCSRLLQRMLRLGIRNMLQLDEENIVLFVNKRFYEYNFVDNVLRAGFVPPAGVRALNLTPIEGIDGFEDMICFGGYLSNPDRKPVSIYKRIDTDTWMPIFSFGEGDINHIHNIIPDSANGCVWIQTGDFEDAAGLWMATDNFRIVVPVYFGSQQARGCVAFPINGKLLYATDTPLEINTIRVLEKCGEEWLSTEVCEISGSCIYACQIGDSYVFSTTVEPSGLDEGLKGWLTTQRGWGIKDNYCHVYCGNLDKGFVEIYKARKDSLPYALFQFGTLQFPKGENRTGRLFVYHVSTAKHNLQTIELLFINNS